MAIDPKAASSNSNTANRLISETSPYLLQHANNPVDWYPWGEEAFQAASREDRPVFLSVGYSTCHWCHVMARESFQDPEVAELLNRTFICIKVDREERPDIDQIYMKAAQAMTGRGGWPLSIIMTADKKPFFAATYIPKRGSFGQAGMMEIIPRIGELWQESREELLRSADQILDYLKQNRFRPSLRDEAVNESLLKKGYDALASVYDPQMAALAAHPSSPLLTTSSSSCATGRRTWMLSHCRWWRIPSRPCAWAASSITWEEASTDTQPMPDGAFLILRRRSTTRP